MSNIFADSVVTEFDREMRVTREVLSLVPEDKLDWKPHPKSMSLKQLAAHVAIFPDWFLLTVQKDGLNFAEPNEMPKLETAAAMLAHFDRQTAAARAALAQVSESRWADNWPVKQGDHQLHAAPRWTIYRLWDMNHLIHHRGQLNLYLRLLDIPVATIYFNSADKPEFTFE